MRTAFRIITTRQGHVGIAATARGLRRVYALSRSRDAVRRAISRDFADAVEDHTLLPDLAERFQRYFRGEPVEFRVRLDCSGASSFQIAVWNACRKVRYGQTTSYKELAAAIGRPSAARAVGAALGRNPLPIVVPCHRVIRSDGSPGGYSGPGGRSAKRRMLEMEAVGVRSRLVQRGRGEGNDGRPRSRCRP